MKNYNPNKDSSFLAHLDMNDLYSLAEMEPLSLCEFEWVEDISMSNEEFMNNYSNNYNNWRAYIKLPGLWHEK